MLKSLAGALALLTVSAIAVEAQRQAVISSGSVRLQIDFPFSAAVIQAPFVVSGWTFDTEARNGTGIELVRVEFVPFDGGASVTADAVLGISRPDLIQAFGSRAQLAGFQLTVRAPLRPGSYVLRTFVRKTGQSDWAAIGERNLTIAGTALSDLAPCLAGQVARYTGQVWTCDTAVGVAGPPGPAGPAGPVGPAGPTGATGPAAIVLRDADGRQVGDVVTVNSLAFPEVVIRVADQVLLFRVDRTRMHGIQTLLFESSDCTGPAYFGVSAVDPLSVFELTGVRGSSGAYEVYTPATGASLGITARSRTTGVGGSSACFALAPESFAVYRGVLRTTLTFKAPFRID